MLVNQEQLEAMGQGKRSSLGHYPNAGHQRVPSSGNPIDRSKINSPRQLVPQSEAHSSNKFQSPEIRNSANRANEYAQSGGKLGHKRQQRGTEGSFYSDLPVNTGETAQKSAGGRAQKSVDAESNYVNNVS